jgi:hypothetical protein
MLASDDEKGLLRFSCDLCRDHCFPFIRCTGFLRTGSVIARRLVDLGKSSKIYFSADTSGPTDQKDVYGYLNKNHSDSDHRCYCITGSVISQSRGTGVARVFTEVTGLKTCGGQILR